MNTYTSTNEHIPVLMKTYTGEDLKPIGVANVNVQYRETFLVASMTYCFLKFAVLSIVCLAIATIALFIVT
jgi:hypothetical protein